jgi:anaerobic sulfite reductase subunit B
MKPAPAPGAQHVPATLHLIDAYDDGRDARHLTFACVDAPHTFGNAMPGQFFMLNVPGAGEIALTFSALPDARGHFGALVRRVGSVTSALFALAPGAVLGARGPFGNGWPMLQLASGRVLVVGGGCGLAPLVAAVRQLHDHGVAHAVLYSARDHHAQILHSERAQWHRDGIALLEVFDEPHRIGPVPHLDAALAALGGMPDTVITCGPGSHDVRAGTCADPARFGGASAFSCRWNAACIAAPAIAVTAISAGITAAPTAPCCPGRR